MKKYKLNLILGATICIANVTYSQDASKSIEDYEMSQPQLIMVTFGANDVRKLSNFYENVFGFTFVPSLGVGEDAVHARVSSGLFLGVNGKYGVPADQSVTTLHISVPNLAKYEENILSNGGRKIYPPARDEHVPLSIAEKSLENIKETYSELTHLSPDIVTNSLGDFALYEDCEKNPVSLIQLEQWARPYYAHGRLKDIEYKEMMLAFKAGKQ